MTTMLFGRIFARADSDRRRVAAATTDACSTGLAPIATIYLLGSNSGRGFTGNGGLVWKSSSEQIYEVPRQPRGKR